MHFRYDKLSSVADTMFRFIQVIARKKGRIRMFHNITTSFQVTVIAVLQSVLGTISKRFKRKNWNYLYKITNIRY